MVAISAGLLLWRRNPDLEVLIVHPGGPFWAKKDNGAWSLPKGEFEADREDGRVAAMREFAEELGCDPPAPDDRTYLDLGETRLKSGKRIVAWGVEGDLDVSAIVSNTFEIEWPPRSGRRQAFPEVDRAIWCSPAAASVKLNPAQVVFVERLADQLGDG